MKTGSTAKHTGKREIDFSGWIIPISSLPPYQLLAKKHNLLLCNMKIKPNNRIGFVLKGDPNDIAVFHKDLEELEEYEDRLSNCLFRIPYNG